MFARYDKESVKRNSALVLMCASVSYVSAANRPTIIGLNKQTYSERGVGAVAIGEECSRSEAEVGRVWGLATWRVVTRAKAEAETEVGRRHPVVDSVEGPVAAGHQQRPTWARGAIAGGEVGLTRGIALLLYPVRNSGSHPLV